MIPFLIGRINVSCANVETIIFLYVMFINALEACLVYETIT